MRKEVTCRCSAYDFPHRFGAGRCNGLHLVQPGAECELCHLNNGGCEVIKGKESPSECRYVIDFCQFHEVKIKQ